MCTSLINGLQNSQANINITERETDRHMSNTPTSSVLISVYSFMVATSHIWLLSIWNTVNPIWVVPNCKMHTGFGMKLKWGKYEKKNVKYIIFLYWLYVEIQFLILWVKLY